MGINKSKGGFFNNLKQFREQHGQSIEELAEQSGVSLDMLKQLEQNIFPEEMMTSDAYKLAKYFHCTLAELFCL